MSGQVLMHATHAIQRGLYHPLAFRAGRAASKLVHGFDRTPQPSCPNLMQNCLLNRFHSSWVPSAATQRLISPAWTHLDCFNPSSSRSPHGHNALNPRSPLLAHHQSIPRLPPRHVVASAALAHATSSGGVEEDEDLPGELHAVETAIRANMLIFAAKLAVYFMSSSSAMLAEAVHSLVDIANQMLLRVGLVKSQKRPNEIHPYGYTRDQFIWPLISAVGIFCCGAGVSLIHGLQGLFETRELGDLYWNFVVLGVSGVLESHSLWVAINTLQKRAASQAMTLLEYLKTGADPAAVAVMMEDGAAVAGLLIAAGCLAMCQWTGHVAWDAVGSIAVSLLLGGVAVVLIQRNRKWLIGKSMPKAQEEQILAYLLQDKVIKEVTNIKSEELGVRQYRFQADIAFDGEELARRCLDRCGRVRLFKALDAAVKRHDPHALDALLMQFAAVIVSTTGAEVDRMEREIMRLVPGTKYVDLETDRGRPSRPSAIAVSKAALSQLGSSSNASSSSGGFYQQQPAAQPSAASAAGAAATYEQLRRPGPLDSVSEVDHLADLVHYPLGSLSSFEGLDEQPSPEWLSKLQQQHGAPGGAEQQQEGPAVLVAPFAAQGGSSSGRRPGTMSYGVPQGEYEERLLPWESTSTPQTPHGLGIKKLHMIEDSLIGSSDDYKPFCEEMYKELHGDDPKQSSTDAAGQRPDGAHGSDYSDYQKPGQR